MATSKTGSYSGRRGSKSARKGTVTGKSKDAKPKEISQFPNILDRVSERLETDVLRISTPRGKLDPIAAAALKDLRATYARGQTSPKVLEQEVRDLITNRGIASKVKRVTDRLNRRTMTEGRRWVLASTYLFLLSKSLKDKSDEAVEKLMEDDLGVADKIMVDLEEKGGPFDRFANLIVESVITRNRITKNDVISKIVSQQVRAAI